MATDLEIVNGLDWVRRNEDRLLSSNNRALEIATGLIGDVLILAGSVQAYRDGEWWVIGSGVDWIGFDGKYNINEIFSQMTPFPEAGDNSMRAEILLFCFARDVVTFAQGELTIIKGEFHELQLIDGLKYRSDVVRWVLFRV